MAEMRYITANSSKFFENIDNKTDFKIQAKDFKTGNLFMFISDNKYLVYEE